MKQVPTSRHFINTYKLTIGHSYPTDDKRLEEILEREIGNAVLSPPKKSLVGSHILYIQEDFIYSALRGCQSSGSEKPGSKNQR